MLKLNDICIHKESHEIYFVEDVFDEEDKPAVGLRALHLQVGHVYSRRTLQEVEEEYFVELPVAKEGSATSMLASTNYCGWGGI